MKKKTELVITESKSVTPRLPQKRHVACQGVSVVLE